MSGSIHLRKDTGWWFVLWYDPSIRKGVRIVKYKGERMYSEKIAQKLLSIMQSDVENGTFRLEKYTDKGWTDTVPYLKKWLEAVSPTLSPATIKDYTNSIDNHLIPFFTKHQVQLHEIQSDTLIDLLNSIDRDGKGKLNVMYCLRACLDFAWRAKRIQAIPPFPKRKLYNIQTPPIIWIKEDRQMSIINAIPETHRPIFLWLKYHVRRPAEACALHKVDFDPVNMAFIVRRSISARKLVDRTKTGMVHIIPCHSEFRDLAIRCLQSEGPFFFVNPLARRDGKRYTNESLNIIWKKACKDTNEDIDLYSGLKHSTISQFLNEKDMSLQDVQMVTDHARLDSLKPYAKTELARKRELMEKPKVVYISDISQGQKMGENNE